MPSLNNQTTKESVGEKKQIKRAVKTPDEFTKMTNPVQSDFHTARTTNRPAKSPNTKTQSNVKKYIARSFIALGVALVLVIYVVFSLVSAIATGPSPTLRDQLVLMAMQASATKWVPGLFLPDEAVQKIVDDSHKVSTEVINMDEYFTQFQNNGQFSNIPGQSSVTMKDPWEDAVDGMLLETINRKTFKAYVLLIKDPSRVFVGTSSDYKSGKKGMDIFGIAAKYNAVAAINGGEFSDPGGVGDGSAPIGITFSQGKLMWNDGYTNRTFIGIDNNNKLVVSEGMTKSRAEELGIRDGVCFQNGNILITNENGQISLHRADNDTGTAQRTAIGQRADGTIIMIVTDGRTTSSIGATHNDMVDLMSSYGAVTASKLDGGSSSMMYYNNYFEKYDYDYNKLDAYQKRGLVNKYKAFTSPRLIPTFFIVGGESSES